MNANTISYAASLPGAAQGASSTTEFQFKNAAGVIAELTVPANVLNKRRFKLVAGGRLTTGAATNFTVKFYVGTALGAALWTSGAIACNTTSGAWHIEVEGLLDSTAKVINGTGTGGVAAVMTTPAVATAAADPTTALVFGVSGTMSASHANTKAFMDYFELDVQ
jgi:hypothetical protein